MSNLPPPDFNGFNFWEWLGAAGGTLVSIIYARPTSRVDFISRVVVSLLFGGTFGFIVGQSLGWPETARHAVASGAAMAFFSYAAIGVVFRVLKGVDKWPPK